MIRGLIFIFGVLAAHGVAFGASAEGSCSELLVNEKAGYDFLHKRDPSLHITHYVEQHARRIKRRDGQALQKPSEKLQSWLNSLEEKYAKYSRKSKLKQALIDYYLYNFAINKENFPPSYFDQKKLRDRRRGIAIGDFSDQQKSDFMDLVIYDQHHSLLPWLDFLLSPKSSYYPAWAKHWALMGVLGLTKYNPVLGTFGHRDGVQVVNFPELNLQALMITLNSIVQKVEERRDSEFDDERFRQLVASANFGKIYGHAFKHLGLDQYSLEETAGRWVAFRRSKRAEHTYGMVRTLEGRNAGWCIATSKTANEMLSTGDFHIYYSNDSRGEPRVPRVAIRMVDSTVAEVRGIMPDQDFDPYIAQTSIVQDKLRQIGESGRKFMKKTADMQKMTEIENKHYKAVPLSVEELRFLYEVEGPILGFGFGRDPRIDEIINARDLADDMFRIGECAGKVSLDVHNHGYFYYPY